MKRRSLLPILSMSLAGLLLQPLSACVDGDRVPLVVWYAIKAPYGDQYGQMLKGYEADHPHVSVEARNFASSQALRTALEHGAALPDVALIDESWQDELIGSDRIVPVEDTMTAASGMARIVFKADTYPALFQLSLKDGKLWTMPTFATDTALVYNARMFSDKKLTKPPVNWGQMVAYARKLTDPDNGVWGFELPFGPGTESMGQLYTLMLWQMGADMLNADDQPPPSTAGAMPAASTPVAATPTPAAATPAVPPAVTPSPAAPTPGSAVTAAPSPAASAPPAPPPDKPAAAPAPPGHTPAERLVGFLSDLVYRYKVSSTDAPTDVSKYAMTLGTPETLLAAESQGLTMLAAPFPLNKVKAEALTVYSFAITRDAHDRNEAYQFANWAADFQQSVVWTTSTPFLPANKQVTLSPQYFEYLTQYSGLRTFLAEMGVGRLEPVVPKYERLLSEVGQQLDDAITQHEDAAQAAQAISDRVNYIRNQPQGTVSASLSKQ